MRRKSPENHPYVLSKHTGTLHDQKSRDLSVDLHLLPAGDSLILMLTGDSASINAGAARRGLALRSTAEG